jgi:hypothetical protein
MSRTGTEAVTFGLVSPGASEAMGYPAEPPVAGSGLPRGTPGGQGQTSRSTIALVLGIAAALLVTLIAVDRATAPDNDEALPANEATSTTAPGEAEIELPPVDPAIQEAVADLHAYVANARGHDFVREVPVRLVGDELFAALVEEFFQIDPARLSAVSAYYEAIGLIPEGTAAIYAAQLLLRYQSALGFYDPETEVLIVNGDELDAGTRGVIVHELVHALDDQWFDLHRPEYEGDRTSEHVETFPMVYEGNAVRIQEQWIADLPADERAEAREAAGGPPGGALTDNAGFVDFGVFARYQAGAPFVTGLAASGGERLIDAVLLDPPDTTEQVLHPEVFERREGRLPVPPPPSDGPVIDQGVVGAYFWLGLLTFAESELSVEAAEAAVRGWGGDWSVTWVDGQITCTRTDVEGDTPADTDELLSALTEYAAAHPGVQVSEADGRARMEVCYEVPIAGPDAR